MDLGLHAAIHCVEMRRNVIAEVHLDHDSEETGDFWHMPELMPHRHPFLIDLAQSVADSCVAPAPSGFSERRPGTSGYPFGTTFQEYGVQAIWHGPCFSKRHPQREVAPSWIPSIPHYPATRPAPPGIRRSSRPESAAGSSSTGSAGRRRVVTPTPSPERSEGSKGEGAEPRVELRPPHFVRGDTARTLGVSVRVTACSPRLP